MKFPGLFLTLILFYLSQIAVAQNITVKANKTPLNQLLIELRNSYNLQLSFDDKQLAGFPITINKQFSSPEAALQEIVSNLPLRLAKRGETYIIVQKISPINPKEKIYFSGQISEKGTLEPLPFSYITLDNRIIVSDVKGIFSILLPADTTVRVKISHLGHYILDTTVVNSPFHRFCLTPSSIGLREIVVRDKSPDRSTQIGDKAGSMKINHQIAKFLPGNDDNSVFNFMRLQPGILASSEQSNGLMIWGSYEGQSKIMFDEFTIWGLKSFNDDISTINPLIIKDIEIFKGGYDASYGDRVGGIVRISGKSGITSKPTFSLNINNVTMNGLFEMPLWKNSSLMLSFRQTYYNLYDGKDVVSQNSQPTIFDSLRVAERINQDVTVVPDYRFHDANIKFSAKTDSGNQFYISILGGEDKFMYKTSQQRPLSRIEVTNNENNLQTGASIFYGRVWKKGYTTNFSISYAELDNKVSDLTEIKYSDDNQSITRRDNRSENIIREFNFVADNWFSVTQYNKLQFGAGIVNNDAQFVYKSFGVTQTILSNQSPRLNLFLLDHINLSGKINFNVGLRADYPKNLSKIYWQPRLSLTASVSKSVKLNMAWGIYNQFIAKSSVIDEFGNYHYIWTSSDNNNVPILDAMHFVVGSSFKTDGFTANAEMYYKKINGLTRFIQGNFESRDAVYEGEGRSFGMDLYLKKDFKGHSAWLAYTLSRTEEKFPYYARDDYYRAPQDQRHELKLAALLNLSPFYLSANYVFGTGFPINEGSISTPQYHLTSYNRLDMAFFYRFTISKLYGEAGLTILNLFDTQNIRYSNFNLVPLDQNNAVNIYTEAVPFSPRLSLKIQL